jgi:hypothetical protein
MKGGGPDKKEAGQGYALYIPACPPQFCMPSFWRAYLISKNHYDHERCYELQINIQSEDLLNKNVIFKILIIWKVLF